MYQSLRMLDVRPMHHESKVDISNVIGVGLLLWGAVYIVQGLAYLLSQLIFNY